MMAWLWLSGSMGWLALVATLLPGPRYRVRWAGEAAEFTEPLPGVLEILLPSGTRGAPLIVDKAG